MKSKPTPPSTSTSAPVTPNYKKHKKLEKKGEFKENNYKEVYVHHFHHHSIYPIKFILINTSST